MSLILSNSARLLAVSALGTLSLATGAEAQMSGQGPGQGGGMMGGGWGWATEWAASEGSAFLCSLWSSLVSVSRRSVAAVCKP
jgi:hypothetical protein